MPYPGVPKDKEEKMDRCVEDVMKKQGVSKSRAIAICRTSIVGKKDLSLTERAELVRQMFKEASGEDYWQYYPVEVYDSYIVVRFKSAYWQIGYALSDSYELTLDESGWILVEHNYTPVEKFLRRDIDCPIKSAEMGTFKAYAILYGSPEKRDLDGHYFDKDTNYYLDWYNTRPWLYHHGRHPMFATEGAKSHRIGYWTKTVEDEDGIFLIGELDERHKYLDQIELLISKEYQYPSSGTLSYIAKADKNLYITDWPIAELSSTVRPAEYRMPAIAPEVQEAMKILATI